MSTNRSGKKSHVQEATCNEKNPVAISAAERLAYRPPEGAAVLGIGLTSFYHLLKTGQLECRKIGSATIVTAEALRKYVESLPAGR